MADENAVVESEITLDDFNADEAPPAKAESTPAPKEEEKVESAAASILLLGLPGCPHYLKVLEALLKNEATTTALDDGWLKGDWKP